MYWGPAQQAALDRALAKQRAESATVVVVPVFGEPEPEAPTGVRPTAPKAEASGDAPRLAESWREERACEAELRDAERRKFQAATRAKREAERAPALQPLAQPGERACDTCGRRLSSMRPATAKRCRRCV